MDYSGIQKGFVFLDNSQYFEIYTCVSIWIFCLPIYFPPSSLIYIAFLSRSNSFKYFSADLRHLYFESIYLEKVVALF